MEPDIQRKIEATVVDILRGVDMNQATEFNVRFMASMRLGIDLSNIESKKFVREIVESFLLSSAGPLGDAEDHQALDDDGRVAGETSEARKEVELDGYGNRVICRLSDRRSVTVHDYNGKSLVSIREWFLKDGLELFSNRGISLPSEQWSVVRKSMSDVDTAIAEMQSRLRRSDDLNGSRTEKCNSVPQKVASTSTVLRSEKVLNGVSTSSTSTRAELQSEEVSNGVTTSTPCAEIPSLPVASTHCNPVSDPAIASAPEENVPTATANSAAEEGIAWVSVDRFDGKNYKSWVINMELFLKQLKVAHALSDPCPVVAVHPGSKNPEQMIPPAKKAAERKWLNDDHLCRLHILSCLSDSLYHQFSKTTHTAKELWDQLKQVYLYEDLESKRAQVKRYIEFQIVEEKSIFQQVHELNNIADAIGADGTIIHENFHVSAVLSKLPQSWQNFCIKLKHEEHLPFRMLMDMIKVEEQLRTGGSKQVEFANNHLNNHNHHANNLGPRTRELKRPGVMQWTRHGTGTEMESNRLPICFCCGKKGHFANQCRNRKFDNEDHHPHQHHKSFTHSVKGGDPWPY
ncbi:unnamed protein product [Linum tenue]|uniref:CCHC-type domain-containing protein n=1 Tax=Linum tenue TaxID=586396 RepID=A0AAV0PIC0_9ROSI|nr:unnamed protein product [Linum tenue]